MIGGWYLFVPIPQPSSLQEGMRDIKYTIKHAGIKGYEKASMQQQENTEELGYWLEEILRSLVAPPPMGRRISKYLSVLLFGYIWGYLWYLLGIVFAFPVTSQSW